MTTLEAFLKLGSVYSVSKYDANMGKFVTSLHYVNEETGETEELVKADAETLHDALNNIWLHNFMHKVKKVIADKSVVYEKPNGLAEDE